jgi:hypothetical protein
MRKEFTLYFDLSMSSALIIDANSNKYIHISSVFNFIEDDFWLIESEFEESIIVATLKIKVHEQSKNLKNFS